MSPPPLWAYQADYFDPPPDEELICSICRSVFCDPVQSPCNHVYCRNCITKWLEKNRNCPICRERTTKHLIHDVVPLIKNMIMKLTLRCRNVENGCQEKFSLEACESHLKVCTYEVVHCRNKPCEEKLMRKDMLEHENNCPYRSIKCQTCRLKIKSLAPNKHNCIRELRRRLRGKIEIIKQKDSEIKDLQEEVKSLKEAQEQYESSSLGSISAGDIMINLPSFSSDSSMDSTSFISETDDDDDSSFHLSTSDILEGLESRYNRLNEGYMRDSYGNDDSIEYPRSSSPTEQRNSTGVVDPLDSTFEEEPQVRRPAKRRLPPRTLETSEDDNDRDLELPPVPSPKRSWRLFSREDGQSSSQMADAAQSAEGNLPEGAVGPSSSNACGSRNDAPGSSSNAAFKLRPKLKKGSEQSASGVTTEASRNGQGTFERTIALLEQYNLESDPEWLPSNSRNSDNAESDSDNLGPPPNVVPNEYESSEESSLSDDSSEDSYENNRNRRDLIRSFITSSSSDDPDWEPTL